MELTKFLRLHDACDAGRDWALATGCGTIEEVWQRGDLPPEWCVWIATRPDVLSDRDLRMFACACCRRPAVWSLLTDERSRRAVEVAEGRATAAELAAAEAAAWAAAWAADSDAAEAAARAAAWAAAKGAAWAAARDAAWAAARDAAWAAGAAERAAQAAWLLARHPTIRVEVGL